MAAMNKIAPNSPSRVKPSELESSIANALYDLESNIPDMKSALRPLQFVSAREVCRCCETALEDRKALFQKLKNHGRNRNQFTSHTEC